MIEEVQNVRIKFGQRIESNLVKALQLQPEVTLDQACQYLRVVYKNFSEEHKKKVNELMINVTLIRHN